MPSGYVGNGHTTLGYYRRFVFLDERSDRQNVQLDDKRSKIIRDHYKNYPKIESKYYLEHKRDNDNHKIE